MTAFGQDGAATRSGLLQQLWRARLLFACVFVPIVVLAAVVLQMLPPTYEAAGSVIVAEEQPVSGLTPDALIQKVGDPADLESELLMASSPRLLRIVTARPDVIGFMRRECERRGSAAHCATLVAGSDVAVAWAQTHYSVGIVGRSRVIQISYRSPLPATARFMANALIEAYLADSRQHKLGARAAALAWVRERLADASRRMAADDAALEAYRQKHDMLRGKYTAVTSERLTELDEQLAKARGLQAAADAEAARGADGEGADVSDAQLGSRTIDADREALSSVDASIAAQSGLLGANNPKMQALSAERNTLSRQLGAETQRISRGLQRDAKVANSQVASLEAQIEAAENQVGTATDAETSMSGLTWRAEHDRANYDDFFRRANALETETRVLEGDVHLVNLAEEPRTPVFPKKRPFMAAAIVVAAAIAAGITLLRAMGDDRVRDVGALEIASGLPALVSIPMSRLRRRSDGDGLALEDEAPLDALHVLHAQLEQHTPPHLSHARPGRAILVTSTGSGEGKTTLALRLASLAAARGRRVLLVECDVRAPQLGVAGLAPAGHPGLGSYLAGQASFGDIVTRGAIRGVDLIAAGRDAPKPSAVMTPARIALLLQHAAEYDLVLFDGTAVDNPAPLAVLARQADRVLYCVRWEMASSRAVLAGIREVQELGGQVVGLAITCVPDAAPRLASWQPPALPQLPRSAA